MGRGAEAAGLGVGLGERLVGWAHWPVPVRCPAFENRPDGPPSTVQPPLRPHRAGRANGPVLRAMSCHPKPPRGEAEHPAPCHPPWYAEARRMGPLARRT